MRARLVCNRYCPNPLGIVPAEVIESFLAGVKAPNRTVILSQRARWRENPPDIQSAK